MPQIAKLAIRTPNKTFTTQPVACLRMELSMGSTVRCGTGVGAGRPGASGGSKDTPPGAHPPLSGRALSWRQGSAARLTRMVMVAFLLLPGAPVGYLLLQA